MGGPGDSGGGRPGGAEWRVCNDDKCGPLIFSQPVCHPLHWLQYLQNTCSVRSVTFFCKTYVLNGADTQDGSKKGVRVTSEMVSGPS